MKCKVSVTRWKSLVRAIKAVRPNSVSCGVRDEKLTINASARSELIHIRVEAPVENALDGSVSVPARAFTAIKSADDMHLECVPGALHIGSGPIKGRSAVLSRDVPIDDVQIGTDETSSAELLKALLVAHAGRDVGSKPDEPAQHNRDEIPFLLLSISGTRTVGGLPGARAIVVGPGVHCLPDDPIHVPLGIIPSLRSLIKGCEQMRSNRLDRIWSLTGELPAGVRIEIRIQLQPDTVTPFDTVTRAWVEHSFGDGLGTELARADISEVTRHLTGTVVCSDSRLQDADGNECPAASGWPAIALDPLILSRVVTAIGSPETVTTRSGTNHVVVRSGDCLGVILRSRV